MTQVIEIEGGIARVVDRRVVSQAPLEQLAPFLETRMPTILPILPDHTRVVAFDPNTKKGILIVETVPFRQHVTCHVELHDYNFTSQDDLNRIANTRDRRVVWNLQFPYQYHVYTFSLDTGPTGQGLQNFQLNEGKLLWRPTKMTKLDDGFWPAQLFNIDTNARICWGYTQAETASLAQRIDDQVKSFQATIFNTHLGAKKPHNYSGYTAWEEASDKNPLCYLDWSNFKTNPMYTGTKLVESITNAGAIPANLDNTTSIIAPPPDTFTLGKAREWMERIDPQQRKLFLTALAKTLAAEGDATLATSLTGETAGKKAEVVNG